MRSEVGFGTKKPGSLQAHWKEHS